MTLQRNALQRKLLQLRRLPRELLLQKPLQKLLLKHAGKTG